MRAILNNLQLPQFLTVTLLLWIVYGLTAFYGTPIHLVLVAAIAFPLGGLFWGWVGTKLLDDTEDTEK